MRINPDVLAGELEILVNRFHGHKLLDVVLDRYAAYIDRHLSESEFLLAAQVIFENDTYWPSPLRFVEAARGNPKERAVSEWGQLMIALKDNPAELPLTDRGRAALKAVGGYRALMEATDYGMEKLHKRFLEAYVDEGEGERRVPVIEGKVQGVISEAVKAIQGEG